MAIRFDSTKVRDYINRFLRDFVVPVLLVLIKLLTALRTGVDTYAVSHSLLNVLLLDFMFLAFWWVLAYSPDTQQMRRFRPFALIGAWVMFGFMIAIGSEAHQDNPLVATAVRSAGGSALALDTWDYVSESIFKFLKWIKVKFEERKKKRSEIPPIDVYTQRIVHDQLKKSVKAASAKLRTETDKLVMERMSDELPELIVALMAGSMTLNSSTEELPQSTANDRERPRTTVIERWNTVYPLLGLSFSRADVQREADCGKSLAVEIINYGKSIGAVVDSGKGMYAIPVNGNHRELN